VNIGCNCYSNKNESKKALDYYQKAFKYSDNEQDKVEIKAKIERLQGE
jgi:hypothetical protein